MNSKMLPAGPTTMLPHLQHEICKLHISVIFHKV